MSQLLTECTFTFSHTCKESNNKRGQRAALCRSICGGGGGGGGGGGVVDLLVYGGGISRYMWVGGGVQVYVGYEGEGGGGAVDLQVVVSLLHICGNSAR